MNSLIKDKLHPSVYGVGFVGVGKYKPSINGSITKAYSVWHSMLNRCYNLKYQAAKPTYAGCSVCDEWHNFQEFASWFEINYQDGLHLDKDLLVQGNKIYGPEFCLFVSAAINSLLVDSKASRGLYPQGVILNKLNKKFMARMSINGKVKHLGTFLTPKEASAAYIKAKCELIKQIAIKQSEPLRSALLSYKMTNEI